MKPVSKRFRREVVSVVMTLAILAIYVPFIDTRWAIYVAMCVGYTIALFGLAWSDGKLLLIFDGTPHSVNRVLQTHLVFLLSLVAWIWLAQYFRPSLPSWVQAGGDYQASWFLFFALMGIVGILLIEQWWFSKARKRVAEGHKDPIFR